MPVRDPLTKGRANLTLEVVDHVPVQVETFGGVSHGAAPIAPLEAALRAPGDLHEGGLEPVEAGDDRGHDRACEPACGEVADSALCHQVSVGEAQGLSSGACQETVDKIFLDFGTMRPRAQIPERTRPPARNWSNRPSGVV